MLRHLGSPLAILSFVWCAGLITYAITASLGDDLIYFRLMTSLERIEDDATVFSYIWLLLAMLSFGVGVSVAQYSTDRNDTPSAHLLEGRIARVLPLTALIIFGVGFAWIGVATIELGGLQTLVQLASSENMRAREMLLTAAFPGGRLIASGAITLGVVSATILANQHFQPLRAQTRAIALTIFAVSMAYLAAIPIVMSGRLNFFAATIAAYVSVCFVHRRLVGVSLLPLVVLVLAIAWGAKEYFNQGHVAADVSPIDRAYQGFLFYVHNDVANALNPVGNLGDHHTWGWYSLRFVFFFTFTDEALLQSTLAAREDVQSWIGGGEVPLLAAPYVDFGMPGLLVLAGIGFFCQRTYLFAVRSPLYAAAYGLVAAGLSLSLHSGYLTSQELVFNMLLTLLLMRLISKRRTT